MTLGQTDQKRVAVADISKARGDLLLPIALGAGAFLAYPPSSSPTPMIAALADTAVYPNNYRARIAGVPSHLSFPPHPDGVHEEAMAETVPEHRRRPAKICKLPSLYPSPSSSRSYSELDERSNYLSKMPTSTHS